MDASDTGQDRASESEEPESRESDVSATDAEAVRMTEPQAAAPQMDEPQVDASQIDEPPRPTIAASAFRAATTAADAPEQGDAAAVEQSADATHHSESGEGSETADPVAAAATDAAVEADADADGGDEPAEPDANLEAWRSIPLATRIEALLFAATDPVPFRRLQSLAGDVDAGDVRDAIESLQAHYKATARAFGIQEIGGGYQLRTEAALSELLARLGRKTSSEKLSPAAIETLAIVAYRQPVLRVDVEKIRGVASGEVLRTLVEKGVVRVAGRADLPGSPLLYGTTAAFLEIFGLRDLRDLPSDRELLR